MLKNVLSIDNSRCTGCGGCSLICPVSAIKIIRDKDGFFNPNINDKCIGCGLCIKVCYKAFEEKDGFNILDSKKYLSYSLDEEVRYRASSGGIGEELYKFSLKNEYEICGVIYDYEKNIAKHIVTNKLEDIEKIIGSKYIPSYTEDAFKSLDVNKKYMIIGTPCQIYSLRKFTKYKKINNWILIDFFCHGPASLNLWDKYLDYIKPILNGEKINEINFRDKRNGWHNYGYSIKSKNNEYFKSHNEDIYSECFLKKVDLRECCFECKLRFNKIYSDIRLGDFWGPKCIDDKKGTSIVLSSTILGEKVLKNIRNIYLEEISCEELKVSQYSEGVRIPFEREIFQRELKGDKTLDNIYKDIILPIKRKERRNYYIKLPLRLSKSIIKRILRG
ncbi:Coenzyme F420 hydrogenase/dehydrogenase, beta subunit C-terminal domain [Clostridium perfringens]|uniref:Coenzyme F420 hydrogenase/dehydrogenase, beta subunit C-terminal domain n=1 Tax=Clostridium perfringens TaxID=1502 RepID=UPI002A3084F6|nr:Coenzyme F420 hydrogenase/dehydrogenase, beta subunit C-terminal domain [Clostridium perfringens]MDK0948219.1 Coenzyme F420 hydrogenase/dehydrogenase, beta subunit C-terminal domain [Clostridium perfringens]